MISAILVVGRKTVDLNRSVIDRRRRIVVLYQAVERGEPTLHQETKEFSFSRPETISVDRTQSLPGHLAIEVAPPAYGPDGEIIDAAFIKVHFSLLIEHEDKIESVRPLSQLVRIAELDYYRWRHARSMIDRPGDKAFDRVIRGWGRLNENRLISKYLDVPRRRYYAVAHDWFKETEAKALTDKDQSLEP